MQVLATRHSHAVDQISAGVDGVPCPIAYRRWPQLDLRVQATRYLHIVRHWHSKTRRVLLLDHAVVSRDY